jgi:hypothetical protein
LILRCDKFTTRIAFKYLFGCEKSVSIDHLSRALKNIGVCASETEIHSVFERFDTNFDGHLTFSDVCDFFTPQNPTLKKELNKRTLDDTKMNNFISDYIRDVMLSLVAAS